MQGSSDEQDSLSFNNFNNSLNETANSIHLEYGAMDQDMQDYDQLLMEFIRDQLEVRIRLDTLEGQKIFAEKKIKVMPPELGVYFLPHLILILSKGTKLTSVRDELCDLNRRDNSVRWEMDEEEVIVEVHSAAQMTSYRIRCLSTDSTLHRKPHLLDSKCLIDQLFGYYCEMYTKIYFKETAVLLLYWAYQKQLLNRDISQHELKMLIILIFINFGYGVKNIINQMMNDKDVMAQNRKMISCMRLNLKGETIIDEQLVKNYSRYTIQEKKGFFMPRIKKYMMIKDIIPIHFPLMPVGGEREREVKREVNEGLRKVLDSEREKMSICKNIYKAFRFMNNKFQKQMKVVVDFEEKLAYRQDYCQNFELEMIHPVLGQSMKTIRGHSINRLRQHIKAIYDIFQKGQPMDALKEMMSKLR